MEKFETLAYRRSRKAYAAQCTFEYLISLLVTDAFLARLLTGIGVSDALTGIISSFVSLSFMIQLFSILAIRKRVSAKKMVLIFDTMSVVFFMFMYLIPFLPFEKDAKIIIMVLSILIAYFCKYFVLNLLFKWGNTYVSATKRATFSAKKEMISLFTGMIFTLIVGYIVDRYESLGNLSGGFLFLAISIFVLNICNFVSLMTIQKDEESKNAKVLPLSLIFKNTIGNENFRSVIFLTILWDVAKYFTVGFLGVFKYKDLGMSVLLVQVVNIVANFVRILISKPLGRYSDKTSYAKGFKLGLCFAAVAFFLNVFTTNATWILIIFYTVCYSCAVAGTNQNSFNIVYSYVDADYIVHAMAIKNCVGGLFGFGASLLGGKLKSEAKRS